MPTTDVHLETTLVHIEFESYDEGFNLRRLGLLFNNLANLASYLHGEFEPPVQDGSPWEEPGVFLVGVEMNSPLKGLLEFRHLPVRVAEAFVGVCKHIIFYEQERERREISNQLLQEDVHAKRLQNMEHYLRIARDLNEGDALDIRSVERIMDASRDIQHSGTALRQVEIVEET